MSKDVHIIGGGTVFHVRPHFAVTAPAYGSVVKNIADVLAEHPYYKGRVHCYRTKMAGGVYESFDVASGLRFPAITPENIRPPETNQDVADLVQRIVNDPKPKIIFFPVAMCDFDVEDIQIRGQGGAQSHLATGRTLSRLSTKSGTAYSLNLVSAAKVIRDIRRTRKDIFLVGFKQTFNATLEDQFYQGLRLLNEASCNLVLANDVGTRHNVIVTPERAPYGPYPRREALEKLVDMAVSRSSGKFTKSHVMGHDYVPWHDLRIPTSFRTVVNHCIARGAYKPFQGKTVGHFAVKRDDNTFLTSMRGTDFNKLTDRDASLGLVQVKVVNDTEIVAYGGKPSVGGQSQRIIFQEHPDVDCIVHFHCPMKGERNENLVQGPIPVRSQFEHECGSHECGKNTSDGLKIFEVYNGVLPVKAVMLDKHGPNIVFSKDADPKAVIAFIEKHWDLSRSTSEFDT